MSARFETEILYVTKSEYRDGWGFKEHVHPDYFQVFCVLNGSCTIGIGADSRRLGAGSTAIVAAGMPHYLYTCAGERAMIIDIKFILHSGKAELLRYAGFRATADAEYLHGMEIIADEAVHKRPMFKEIIECRLCELLMDIVRAEGANGSPYGRRRSDTLTGAAHDVAKFIEQSYAQPITLDTLSQKLGYSKIYLCQCFKKQTGESIFSYIYDVRLERAAALLKDTDLDHEQIIARTGFKTAGHFGRLFKQTYGQTPGKYRRSMREIVDVPVFLSSEYFAELNKTERAILRPDEDK